MNKAINRTCPFFTGQLYSFRNRPNKIKMPAETVGIFIIGLIF